MIRSALALSLAFLGLTAFEASAAEVTVAYKGVVINAQGAQPSLFVAGQPITVRYVLDTSVTDSIPDPTHGSYNNGLKELKISVPGAGIAAVSGFGNVNVFNDVLRPNYSTDQLSFHGIASSGILAGLPLIDVEAEFLDFNYAPLPNSTLILNDSMPLSHLHAQRSYATFLTSAGYTYVLYMAEPDETATTCASEGYKGTQLTWCKNICENGLNGKALDNWIHRWTNRYRQLPYCAVDGPSNPT